eukprot:RCo045004
MKLSEPPVCISTLIEAINNKVKNILQNDCGQELCHWLTNNLLPSLAWLAVDHMSSCVTMSPEMTNAVIYQLSTISALAGEVEVFFRDLKASCSDSAASASKSAAVRFSPAQADFLQRKIRQMNILVYTVTCNILRLMHQSLAHLQSKTLAELEAGEPCSSTAGGSEDVDMDLSTSLVWLDEKDYQLCVTLTSKVDINIENCVATVSNVNGTAGRITLKVTHYPVLEQNDTVFKVHFNTIGPKQQRKILIQGKDVGCATFTVTIQDSVQRWKENAKLQPRLLSAIAQKISVQDSDLHVLQVLKSTDEDNDCVVCLLKLFAPRARALLRVLRKYQRCMDFQLLNVVDIREGIPAECVAQYGQPEMGISVSSSLVMENSNFSPNNSILSTSATAEANPADSADKSLQAEDASVDEASAVAAGEPVRKCRKITFSSMNRVERSWTCDVCLSETVPVIDNLVVQEELFRQEIVKMLSVDLDRENGTHVQVIDNVYSLLETKYMGIANSSFVKELLFQLSVHGTKLDELINMGTSIAQQSHTGGKQELFSAASRVPAYQQMVNLFMNAYILKHHLRLTSQEHVQQLAEEICCCFEDEEAQREALRTQENEERTALLSAPPAPSSPIEAPAENLGGGQISPTLELQATDDLPP